MKKLLFIAAAIVALFSSCEKLPLQRSSQYNPKPLDPNQGVSCWEYICSHQNLSSMKDAVEACGLVPLYACDTCRYTFLLLDNTAFGAQALSEADTDKLKDVLLFHIIKGRYSSYYGTISYDPAHVITLWDSKDAIMTIKLYDEGSLSSKQQDKVTLMDQCGTSTVVMATSSDLLMTNGPAHILSKHCVYSK